MPRPKPEAAAKRLAEIAAAIAGGAKPSRFEREIDRLLGTGIPESDPVRDEA